jgi:thymidylate kinase
MIIEFAGCSGAGKTTVAAEVIARLRREHVHVHDFSVHSSSWRTTARNAAVTPVMAVTTLRGGDQTLEHLSLTCARILRCGLSPFWTLARTAAAARIVGQHRIRCRRDRDRDIGVIDEGILTNVQLAFSGCRTATDTEIHAFAEAIPLPDAIVWIDAPSETILNRTACRLDCPRELRALQLPDVRFRIESAQRAYRIVADAPRVAKRVVVFSNATADKSVRDESIDQLVRILRGRFPQ